MEFLLLIALLFAVAPVFLASLFSSFGGLFGGGS